MPDLPLAFTVRLPSPLKMSWPSEKKAAFSSSSAGVAVYEAPSVSELLPFTTTKQRFLPWLLMAAPAELVRETPSRTMACLFLEYTLKYPSAAVPLSLYITFSEVAVLSAVTLLPLTCTMPLASPETVAPEAEYTMVMVRSKLVLAIRSSVGSAPVMSAVLLPLAL